MKRIMEYKDLLIREANFRAYALEAFIWNEAKSYESLIELANDLNGRAELIKADIEKERAR